jgi:hypothetical protein
VSRFGQGRAKGDRGVKKLFERVKLFRAEIIAFEKESKKLENIKLVLYEMKKW